VPLRPDLRLVDGSIPLLPVAKVVVVIPALDEEASIGAVVASVPRSIAGVGTVEVVVVDDGSSDATATLAVTAGADGIVRHARRRGLVHTFKDGVQEALLRGASIVVTLDGDGQHDPAQIPRLLAPLLDGSADISLGIRPLAVTSEGISPVRRYGNMAGSKVASAVLGVDLNDATSGYRAFSREALLRLNVISRYTYTLETLIEAARKQLTIAEVEVPLLPRLHGESRMTHSITRYIRRTGGQAALSVARDNLVPILFRLSILATIVAVACTSIFLLGYHDDGAGRHLPSLLASVLATIAGMGLFVAALLASGIDASRRLVEEALYHIRCVELGPAETFTERRT
jgi:glycosyltransferase involved in cell wall biosynthesis